MRIREKLPKRVIDTLRDGRNYLRHLGYRGEERYCPVCRRSSKGFGQYRDWEGVLCMSCGSMPRHRLTWLYLERMTDLFDGQKRHLLHVAPEPCLEKGLRKRLGSGYLSADLLSPHAMVKMDITDIQYPDESFDVVYCSHVLEHVPDDRGALREIRRVLKPDGWAVLLVPITAAETFEDPSVTDPGERLRLFGQEDHVRRYGPDFAYRLEEAGFDVNIVRAPNFLDDATTDRTGIDSTEDIYVCAK